MGLAKRTARLLMVASIWLVLAGAERVVLAQCQASELLKLGASDAAPGDLFGFSVSVAEDVAIVGAPLDDEACAADPDCDSGAAYVYRLIAGGWVQEAQLTASDAAPGDMFGFSVSASGYVAVIGAIQAEAAEPSPGAAYVFRFDGSGWSEEAKLVASDGAADDAFGFSVSASGDVAVIGAYHADQTAGNSGAAYVYRLDDTGWQEEAKLTASDADVWDTFGFSVSIDGTIAVIGAPGNEDAGPDSGSAYIYRRSTTSWVEKAKLTASDGAEGDEFGHSVCVSDQGVVVGSWQDDSELSNAGSAYVFRFDGSDWIEEATLTASIPSSHAYFGNSVCLDGDVALIGSHRNDSAGPSSGSAYAYRFDGVLWHEVAQLTASDADARYLRLAQQRHRPHRSLQRRQHGVRRVRWFRLGIRLPWSV